MTADLPTAPLAARPALLPGSVAEALLHVVAAFVLVWVAIAALVISLPLGLGLSFALTLALVTARPQAAPILVVTAFLFQNVMIATFTPLVSGDEAFDSLRGANFVVLVTAYGAFLLASFQSRLNHVAGLRPFLLAGLAVLLTILAYLALGIVAGAPRDALVYFRNTLSPLACFHVAVVAASLYRIRIEPALGWLGMAAIAYGYCELVFTMDFLSLFHGDLYIESQMRRQIDTGYWERQMRETGFVLRNLSDVMMTDFFNTPFFSDILPRVFRIGGPNFHPISYAYALAIISVWQIFRSRLLLPLLALPLLLVIGSKGAMALYLLALAVWLGLKVLPARQVFALFLVASIAWVGLALGLGMRSGDYHTLGFLAGIGEFLRNPLGHGLGLGGNLSSTSEHLDWDMAQAAGAASVPVESALGVMLYQMGIGAFVFVGFVLALAFASRKLFLKTRDTAFLFGFVAPVAIACNAVLQEEAFYSPLALGFVLLLLGVTLGSYSAGSMPRSPEHTVTPQLRIDFVGGPLGYRRLSGEGRGQALARAAGFTRGRTPSVVDATAGLGRDAFLLALLGAEVTLIERVPEVAAALREGLARAREDAPDLVPVLDRMRLLAGDARALLPGLSPDVVLVDPMHPERIKSALVKAEMRDLRQVVGDDPDAAELIAAALASARDRVVLKWPRKAALPPGLPAPSHAIVGRSTRYEVFLARR